MITNAETLSLLTILLAFGEGALIGLEREKSRIDLPQYEHKKIEVPGIRTYGLISILGSITALLTVGPLKINIMPPWIFIALTLLFVIILVIFVMYDRMYREGVKGITSYVVFVLTYFIGFLTGSMYIIVALGLTFLTTGILAMKSFTRKLVEKISYTELVSGLELGIIVFIVGPMALSTKYKFYGISIRGAYIFFTLILVISYTSYILYKLKGSESLKLVGFLGGLVNSEATLVNVLKLSPTPPQALKLGVIVNSGMMLRCLFLAIIGAYPFLSVKDYIATAKMIVSGVLLAFIPMLLLLFTYKKNVETTSIKAVIRSPLEFKTAFRGAVIYLLLLIASRFINKVIGQGALLPVSFIGGLGSAGAAIFSALTLAPHITPKMLAASTLLAIAGGLANKPLYAEASTRSKEVLKVIVITSLTPMLILIAISLLLIRL